MIDAYTLEKCKQDRQILQIKINNIAHAIKQIEEVISQSKIDPSALSFLRRKISSSIQDLETLYLIKHEHEKIQLQNNRKRKIVYI